jgi:YfiH family protein
MSLRSGGVSAPPWNGLNLGAGVQDDPEHVSRNRALFQHAIEARPVWLQQVHGQRVVRLTDPTTGSCPAADAAWTTELGVACTVLVADCMPVLMATRDGRAVAAAHAGWRGLAAGVLESCIQALCAGSGAVPADLKVWLGPCIGPAQFEVGAEVLEAFGRRGADAAFVERRRPDGALRWLANLPLLAAERLAAAGVHTVSTDGACTVEDPSRFFSFRRDGRTGRMAAAIWRR